LLRIDIYLAVISGSSSTNKILFPASILILSIEIAVRLYISIQFSYPIIGSVTMTSANKIV
jgi:hypothetical protein